MKKYKLTIAIPTFNRPNELIRLISQLKIFLEKEDWCLIICDNCSSIFPDLNISGYENVKIIKRKFNIGPIANILRIFEGCESDWLMIIGDDDEVRSNFYEIVMGVINKYECNQDFAAFKFKSELNSDQKEKIINNIDEYFDFNSNIKQFSSSVLISTWLYRVKPLKPFIRHAYLNAGLQIPHVIPVLEAIKYEQKKIIYLNAEPIKWNPGSATSTWSFGRTYSLMLMNSIIYPLASEGNNIKYFLKGMIGSNFKNLLGFLLKLNYSIPRKNFNNILIIFLFQGNKFLITALFFLCVRPFLNISYIKSVFSHKLGHSDISRM